MMTNYKDEDEDDNERKMSMMKTINAGFNFVCSVGVCSLVCSPPRQTILECSLLALHLP